MAKPGPKTTPSKLKILLGIDKVNPGRINRNEPPALNGEPECPEDFDDIARERWSWLADKLTRLGLMSQEMQGPMILYCEIWSRWQKSLKIIKAEGHTHVGPHGRAAHPELRIAKDCEVQIRLLHSEFGFNPSSKSAIKANPKPQDALEDFLDEHKA